jgi:hypothetical protein
MKMDGPKAPAAVHGLLGITYHPNEKANVIADYLESQFTSHDLCEENHERQVMTRVQAVLVSVDDAPPIKARRPCDIHKLVNPLKLRKLVDFMVFLTNASGIFQEDHWYM